MTPRISFVPAATTTVTVPAFSPLPVTMPAVDSGNPDVTLSHNTGVPVEFRFGGATQGGIMVPAGQSVLLTGNAAVLAAAGNAP